MYRLDYGILVPVRQYYSTSACSTVVNRCERIFSGESLPYITPEGYNEWDCREFYVLLFRGYRNFSMAYQWEHCCSGRRTSNRTFVRIWDWAHISLAILLLIFKSPSLMWGKTFSENYTSELHICLIYRLYIYVRSVWSNRESALPSSVNTMIWGRHTCLIRAWRMGSKLTDDEIATLLTLSARMWFYGMLPHVRLIAWPLIHVYITTSIHASFLSLTSI